MRELKDSDLFMKNINHDNVVMGRISKILSGAEPSTVILNDILMADIKRKIIDNRKEKIVSEMGFAIETGRMILFTTSPDKRLPDMVPFFVYKQNGQRKVAVNLASIVRTVKNPDGSISYDLGDANKVYSMIYGAYLALDKFDSRTVISPNILYDAAVIWAEMFNKPLYDAFGMNNRERNTALMYFSIKFFLGYIMGCDQQQIESISNKYIDSKKNDLILYMEEKIEDLGLNMYEGLIPYMKILFNDEVTKIRGVRVANVSNTMNVSFYLQKFVSAYSSNALLALCTFPYFIYVVIAAMGKSRMVQDKSFDRIFSNNSREVNELVLKVAKD